MIALEMILDIAARLPDRIAIEEADGTRVTYRELVARARHAARTIAAPIAILPATRSAGFVASCLGAWLAGRPWLPIDPGEPAPRRRAMLERVERALGDASFDGVAYVIPTSGSSGTPKLVIVGPHGLPQLLRSQIATFELAPGARSLWLHAPIFDASISDWGTALASGATLVIPRSPRALRDELVARAITHVDLPPALLPHLADPPPDLRVVVLGGEPCPVDRVTALARRLRVVVVYGPTEATVCSSLVVVDPALWTRPLIGAPLPGIRYQVVDGELWIAGEALALGYAGDPDETARRFVMRDGVRMYRTGDRVTGDDPARLAFAGRLDRQHKLAGRRIELAEIEAVLRRMPGVRDAAAVIRPAAGPLSRALLVAFVEPADEDGSAAGVRAWLAAEVPAWMVPSRIVLGRLPRTATGKLDHAQLSRLPPSTVSITPGDDIERELAALWSELGLALESRDQRFRDAGGDSLAALTLHAALAARGFALASGTLAHDPTFAELAAALRARASEVVLDVETCEARGLAEARRRPAQLVRGRTVGDLVLLTGATGRLGPHLVRAWRARDRRQLAVLVRAPAGVPDAGVLVLCGDVARPDFGLPRERWQELAERVGTVVHAAATIDLAGDWDAHQATNVGGTAEVARFAASRPGIAWHHISTLSVFVHTDRAAGRHDASARPAPEARVFGGYAQTKVAAEAIARAHGATSILRLGLLVDATRRHASDQLAMTIRGLAALGAIPGGAEALRFDLAPVEQVAAAIVERALAAESGGPAIHHLADTRGATFGELVAAMRARGIALAAIAPQRFAEQARERIADPEIAMAYLALGRTHATGDRMRAFDLFLATDADFAVDGFDTTGVLAKLVDGALG